MGLGHYVYQCIMQHALNYERETQLSSRILLRSTLNAMIVIDSDWDLTAARLGVEGQLMNADHHRLLCSDLHIATMCGLYLYVEEAIVQSPAILETYVDSFTSVMPRKSNSPERHMPLQRLSGASLLSTATYSSIIRMHDLPERPRLVSLLARAPLSPRLNDSDMLVAIRHLTKTEIIALLVKFPSGRSEFRPSLLGHGSTSSEVYVTSRGQHDTDFAYGPLWAIGERNQDIDKSFLADPEEILGISDLFLKRGEDINSRCGPGGTFLHAFVCCFPYHPGHSTTSGYIYLTDHVKLFFAKCVARGADLEATGPHGNVLEYTWKQAHVDFQRRHSFFIKVLVDLKVPNSIRDPNGQIPSRERMLAVAEKDDLDAQDLNLYYHGTPTRSEERQEGREGKLARRPQVEPRGGIDAVDAVSMQNTILMPSRSSGGIYHAGSKDFRGWNDEDERRLGWDHVRPSREHVGRLRAYA
jgi:hypothetical protein